MLEEEVEGGGEHAEHDEEQNCDKEILCYLKKTNSYEETVKNIGEAGIMILKGRCHDIIYRRIFFGPPVKFRGTVPYGQIKIFWGVIIFCCI